MKPKTKKAVTLGLALSALGIWVPQILMGVVGTRSTPHPDVSNLEAAGAGEEMDPMAAAMMGAMPAMGAEPAVGEAALMMSSAGEAAAPLSESMERIENRMGSDRAHDTRVDLEQLLAAFQKPRTSEVEAPRHLKKAALSDAESALSNSQSQFESYVNSLRLTAILFGEQGSTAIIGGQFVHAGDLLESGIEILSIQKRSILLGTGGLRRSLTLPSFEAHSGRSANNLESAPLTSTPESAEVSQAESVTEGPKLPQASVGKTEHQGEENEDV